MADFDFAPLLAQIPFDNLLDEIRRRVGLATSTADLGASVAPANGSPARDTVTQGQIRPDEFFRLSSPEAIRKYLAIMKRPQSPRAIVDGLKAGGVLSNAKNFYANVWTELKRARARGEIVNTPSGWGLSEWYPNKPKQVGTAKPMRKKRKGRKTLPSPSALPFKTTVKGSASTVSKPLTWRPFLAQAMKAGKSMQEASKEWKAMQAK